ncbi:MAG: L,D-transpeptidase family protein, partial [Rhodobacteraceae bacterium]|nr:L,D-transpeptidase family protein [Paracoccaceae bacterium]
MLRATAGAMAVTIALTTSAYAEQSAISFAERLAVAEILAKDPLLSDFYADRDYEPLWVGADGASQARLAQFLAALAQVGDHGLPAERYDLSGLMDRLRSTRSAAEMITLEADITRLYLTYARDVGTGLLRPSSISKKELVRVVTPVPPEALLEAIASDDPRKAIADLPPQSAQYRGLQALKLRMEALVAAGGWGEAIPDGRKLEIGSTDPRVLTLRARLARLGYEVEQDLPVYDPALERVVKTFQADNGLNDDGVVGPGTLAELNRSAEERLRSVIVALERERWLPRELGDRHVLVNQTDFIARIIDDGAVTFATRAVIGKNVYDQRSPEFSDEMEHMVINPAWHVPRSIVTKEYLPQLQADPMAVNYLEIRDRSGQVISRDAVDFTQFTQADFPFAMRQPPGRSNALGLVKFMFPNRHNIYLHDTPHKSLFARERRAFSHGCIRLQDPFDFAYALLAKQEEDPKAFFQRVLATGREATVPLEQNVPVHLIYRTAWIGPEGEIWFRRDV